MLKKDFIEIFFTVSDSTLNKINCVSVSLDERGNDFTNYIFENKELAKISFGNF